MDKIRDLCDGELLLKLIKHGDEYISESMLNDINPGLYCLSYGYKVKQEELQGSR